MARKRSLFSVLIKELFGLSSKPKKRKPTKTQTAPKQTGTTTHSAAAGREWVSKVYRDTKDGWFYEKSWPRDGSKYFRVAQDRPGHWRRLFDGEIQGTQHRLDSVTAFLDQDQLWIELECDPQNEHDPNAIKVNGVSGEDRLHIGYVAADDAAKVGGDIPPDVPLVADLSFVDLRKRSFGGYKIEFTVLAPARTCPVCNGDLGRKPRKPGKCKACGEDFALSPLYRIPIPAADAPAI